MTDFTNSAWSWCIAIVTIISIVVLIVFTIKLKQRKLSRDEQAESMGHQWDEGLYELNTPLPAWWVNLFLITLIWGLVYLFLYPGLGSFAGYLGWTQENQYQSEMDAAQSTYGPIFDQYANQDLHALAANPRALEIGESLFSNYCTTCHGSDARGARGYPDLTDNDWLYGGEPEHIKETILNGRNGIMVPWEPVLGNAGVFNVVEYVRTLSGHQADKQVAAKGKAIFSANCAVCHGEDGSGNQLLGAPDLADDAWLYGGSQTQLIETVAKGRNGHMPAHQQFLGEAKVHLLAAYVYSLSKKSN
jgi:cytochrome c oxidase cbb3-type subunit 3